MGALDIRAEDGKDGPLFGRGRIAESGISLTSLIELFSRPRTIAAIALGAL